MLFSCLCIGLPGCASFLSEHQALRGTGDLGVIIERATGSVKVVENSTNTTLHQINGLGDLSHASAVYSRDARYAYIFGRDGGLTKIDILTGKINKRIIQGGNSIGGAISQDGKLIAVSNYSPGGVKVFDSESLALVADIPATPFKDKRSKVVGLVDAPGNRFIFSLFDTNEIWIADFSKVAVKPDKKSLSAPFITKFTNIGKAPYDALITDDGRYYMAGLFGEDGLAKIDLWHLENGVTRVLPNYGKGKKKLPVYKMPHLEGWAKAGNMLFVPAVGAHNVLVIDMKTWKKITEIPVYGQPIFVMSQPDNRKVWVNFAFPNNDAIQVIDTESLALTHTLKPGKAVLHMEFTSRGENVWISSRDSNQVSVYDTSNIQLQKELNVESPSGIFFTYRAHTIGL
ncbi:MAG: protein nirF [Pseudomonadales bacterium]|nr:protein nirF [Pseudomonadales bacterium]